MKVAIVEPHGSGGICHYTYELCRALRTHGVDVYLFTNHRYELEHFDHNFRVSSLSSSRLKARLKQITELAKPKSQREAITGHAKIKKASPSSEPPESGFDRLISRSRHVARTAYMQFETIWRMRSIGIRVVHIQWVWPSRRNLLLVRLAKRVGIKVVYTAHNILPHDDGSDATKSEMGKYYREVNDIIVHDSSSRRELLHLFSVESEKVHVIPHGNYQFFAGIDTGDGTLLRRRFGIRDDREVVLFFGSIQKYKGLNVLLPAFKEALERRPRLHLLIAGKVVEKDGENAAYFNELIRQLGISAAVDFRPGYVAMEDVPTFFTIADVVVAPYIKTYQSGIVQLAYAFGKPVIATNTGGLGEVVLNGESGYVVEPENAEQLAKVIVEIFENRAALERMSLRAANLSTTLFSWEKIAEATARLYGA